MFDFLSKVILSSLANYIKCRIESNKEPFGVKIRCRIDNLVGLLKEVTRQQLDDMITSR